MQYVLNKFHFTCIYTWLNVLRILLGDTLKRLMASFITLLVIGVGYWNLFSGPPVESVQNLRSDKNKQDHFAQKHDKTDSVKN